MARILLLEDDDVLRPLLRRTLENAGHQVTEAGDGREGIRLYQEQPADVVICDLYMPEKDGLETIRELRGSGDVKIIAISGDGPANSSPLLKIALAFGAGQVLSKPIDTEMILEAVQQVLG